MDLTQPVKRGIYFRIKYIAMETLSPVALLVKCPHCGNKFSPEEAIQHDLRAQLEKEFEEKFVENTHALTERIRTQENEKFQLRVQRLEEDRKEKATREGQAER